MGRGSDWCILRTSAPRTLLLAASLAAAGFDVWTPVVTLKKRKPGGRSGTVSVTSPITPTFVFARAVSLGDLSRITRDPVSPHPRFSIFRHYGSIPLISDAEVERLRMAERRSTPKALRKTYRPGDAVKPREGPYTGMTGTIVSSTGKATIVDFGGWMNVTIDTFTICSDDVLHTQPPVGIAA